MRCQGLIPARLIAAFAATLAIMAFLAGHASAEATTENGAKGPAEYAGKQEKTCAATDESCRFDILDFAVIGNTLLTEDEVDEAIEPYLGEHKNSEDIEDARAALDKLYAKRGYQTVGVAIDPAPVDGIVRINVVEEKVSRLRVVGAKYTRVDEIKAEAPSMAQGQVPNFPEIAQDLQVLNQPHRSVTPEIKPGREPDTVEVDLNVQDEFPVSGSLELNNRQSVNTTPLRLSAQASYDNLFQAAHSFSVNYVVAPENRSDSEVESATYTAPLGRGDFTLQFNALNSSSDIAALGNTDVLGKGYQFGGRVIWRAPTVGAFASNVTAGLDYKNFNENVITSAVSAPAPVHYLPFTVAYQGSYQEPNATTHGSITMLYNLDAASSSRVNFDNKRFDARGSFTIFRGEIDREQKFLGDYSIYVAVEGQFADGPLINTESFTLGGYDSVRGYYESEAISDNGARTAVELRSLNLATLLGENSKYISEARLVVFYNGALGWVLQPLPNTRGAYTLQSVGLGGRLSLFKHVYGAFDVAWALNDGVQTKAGDVRSLFRVWTSLP